MRDLACFRVGVRPMAREYQRRKLDCLVEHLEVDLVAIEEAGGLSRDWPRSAVGLTIVVMCKPWHTPEVASRGTRTLTICVTA